MYVQLSAPGNYLKKMRTTGTSPRQPYSLHCGGYQKNMGCVPSQPIPALTGHRRGNNIDFLMDSIAFITPSWVKNVTFFPGKPALTESGLSAPAPSPIMIITPRPATVVRNKGNTAALSQLPYIPERCCPHWQFPRFRCRNSSPIRFRRSLWLCCKVDIR